MELLLRHYQLLQRNRALRQHQRPADLRPGQGYMAPGKTNPTVGSSPLKYDELVQC